MRLIPQQQFTRGEIIVANAAVWQCRLSRIHHHGW